MDSSGETMTQDYVMLNNRLIPRSEASISIDDTGFLYGFGAYDTILALNGRPLFMEDHVKRLNDSIIGLRVLKKGFETQEVFSQVVKLLAANRYKNARVRITVTKGELALAMIHMESPNMTYLITATPLPDDYYHQNIKPLRLLISQYIRNHPRAIPSSLKLTNLANHIFASMEAKEKNYDDGLMINYEGYLSEGSSFNIFFIKGAKVFTPRLDIGILPGITRSVLLKLFQDKGIPCEEGFYKPEDLYEADEAFATSSVRGIVPIVQVNDAMIKTGEQSERIQRYYHEHLKVQSKLP
mgnify:CR=1 FL=1